jgi:hypothetical protein
VRERPTSVGGFPVLFFPHPGRHRVPLHWRGREIRPPGVEGRLGGRMPDLLYGRRDAVFGATGGSGLDAPDAPGGVTSGVWDRASGLALTFETSRAFRTVALYRPPDPTRVSLEPRAALPDALHVTHVRPGIPTGLRSLAPGACYRTWARLTLDRKETP